MWEVKRVNRSQAAIIAELENYDRARVLEAATWAHVRDMTFGQALAAMKKMLPTWGQQKGGSRDTLSSDQLAIAAAISTPAK